MGVTHKLKPDIIQYALAEKQANKKLSCRKLAEMITDKFETKVSKSSVNNLLKSAQLSNPVGRSSKSEKSSEDEEFKIPDEKKKELFQKSLEEIEGTHKEDISKKLEESKAKTLDDYRQEGNKEDFDKLKQDFKDVFDKVNSKPEDSPVVVGTSSTNVQSEDLGEDLDTNNIDPTVIEEPLEEISFKDDEEEKPHLNLTKIEKEVASDIWFDEDNDENVQSDSEEVIVVEDVSKISFAPESEEISVVEGEAKLSLKEDENPSPAPKPDGELIDHAGAIFFKSTQAIFNTQGLSSIFSGLSDYKFTHVDLIDALVSLPAFGINSLADLDNYESQGFWQLNHLSDHRKQDLIGALSQLDQNFSDDLLAHWKRHGVMCSRISMELENEAIINSNPIAGTLTLDEHNERLTVFPLHMAISLITDEWINNLRPMIFRLDQGLDSLSPAFYHLLKCCNLFKGSNIKKFSCLDQDGKPLLELPNYVNLKREFICPVWPWQREYELIGKQDLTFIEQDIIMQKQTLEIAETTIDFPDPDVVTDSTIRAIIVRYPSDSNRQIVLLTNIYDGLSAAEIVDMFTLRWPDLMTMIEKEDSSIWQGSLNQSPVEFPNNMYIEIDENAPNPLTAAIQAFTQKTFFSDMIGPNFSNIYEQMYGQQGFISIEDTAVIVRFSQEILKKHPIFSLGLPKFNRLPIYWQQKKKIFLASHQFDI